ncbi:MAG: AMIN domain-containing protein, partial [Wenzhouxiangellaceae bacterium]
MNRSKRIFALLAALVWCGAGPLSATEVTDIRVSDEGERLRFILATDQPPAEPTVFTTDQPPRIVVELAETTSSVAAAQVPVGIGPVRSYMALSSGDRTRLVVDLSRSTGYEVSVDGNQVVLSVDAGGGGRPASAASAGGEFEVVGIDFRRDPNGAARVILDLDRPGVNISTDQRASELRVNLFNTNLPQRLMERLDVSDFATPVQTITPDQRGENLRLNLGVAGNIEYVAYQSDRQLVIEVAEQVQEARMTSDLQFFQEREFDGDRITLNFQDIPVRSVLQLIADISNLNIVVSD